MSYCSLSDVQGYLSNVTIGPSSKPSDTQVGQYIIDRAAQIDSALKARGLTVPIASPPEFVAELRVLNARGAASDALYQTFPAFSEMGTTQESVYASQLHDDFEARLAELGEGVNLPVGLAITEMDLAPHSFITDNGAYGLPNDQTQDAWGDPIRSEPSFTVGKRW